MYFYSDSLFLWDLVKRLDYNGFPSGDPGRGLNGIMWDMYPMDLFYFLLQMPRSNPVIVKAFQDKKLGFFGDIFRFSTGSMKNRNRS
ncbi:MAG: hypothetical protein A4E37_00076 [Methanoregulaceae archaeon PtaB.Bin056]|nr:MAG: hypothetical protein A4E37_00076 [Methanoregulaceae archaeon PtaB.Bin056]